MDTVYVKDTLKWLNSIPKWKTKQNEIKEFYQLNECSASPQMIWDSSKSLIRGLLFKEMVNCERGFNREEGIIKQTLTC